MLRTLVSVTASSIAVEYIILNFACQPLQVCCPQTHCLVVTFEPWVFCAWGCRAHWKVVSRSQSLQNHHHLQDSIMSRMQDVARQSADSFL